jgi:hypothetical protein
LLSTGVDAGECLGGSGISCVGGVVGGIVTGGAAAVAFDLVTDGAAIGTQLIGLTAGGTGFLGDVAGAVASSESPDGSGADGCE